MKKITYVLSIAFGLGIHAAHADLGDASAAGIIATTTAHTPSHNPYETHSQIQLFDALAQRLALIKLEFEHRDLLENHEQKYYTLPTTVGAVYYIAGVCDQDCGDLDISVRDHRDHGIETDYAYDDIPVVRFTANQPSYKVRVDMESCATKNCFAHVAAYQQITPKSQKTTAQQ